jgi:hypothetical protein
MTLNRMSSRHTTRGVWIWLLCSLVFGLLAACAPTDLMPSAPATVAPIVTPDAEITIVPAQEVIGNGAVDGIWVEYGNISFVADPSLGSEWMATRLEDNRVGGIPAGLDTGPARILFRLATDDYPTAGITAIAPYLFVIPMAELGDTLETAEAQRLTNLLTNRPDLAVEKTLPLLPFVNASQVLHARSSYLDFNGGSGIRYVTLYSQDVSPYLYNSAWYVFEGLTDDGAHYVSAIFPVLTDVFPQEAPEDLDYEAFVADFENYLVERIVELGNAPVDSFTPDLRLLDALVTSLTVR